MLAHHLPGLGTEAHDPACVSEDWDEDDAAVREHKSAGDGIEALDSLCEDEPSPRARSLARRPKTKVGKLTRSLPSAAPDVLLAKSTANQLVPSTAKQSAVPASASAHNTVSNATAIRNKLQQEGKEKEGDIFDAVLEPDARDASAKIMLDETKEAEEEKEETESKSSREGPDSEEKNCDGLEDLSMASVRSELQAGAVLLRKPPAEKSSARTVFRPPPPTTEPRRTMSAKASDRVRSQLYQLRKLQNDSATIDDTLRKLSERIKGSDVNAPKASPAAPSEAFDLDTLLEDDTPLDENGELDTLALARAARTKTSPPPSSRNDHSTDDGGAAVGRIREARDSSDIVGAKEAPEPVVAEAKFCESSEIAETKQHEETKWTESKERGADSARSADAAPEAAEQAQDSSRLSNRTPAIPALALGPALLKQSENDPRGLTRQVQDIEDISEAEILATARSIRPKQGAEVTSTAKELDAPNGSRGTAQCHLASTARGATSGTLLQEIAARTGVATTARLAGPDFDPKGLFERSVEPKHTSLDMVRSLDQTTLAAAPEPTETFAQVSKAADPAQAREGAAAEGMVGLEDDHLVSCEPTADPAAAYDDAFEEWEVAFTDSNHRYFYCRSTGESQWEAPQCGATAFDQVLGDQDTDWLAQWQRRSSDASSSQPAAYREQAKAQNNQGWVSSQQQVFTAEDSMYSTYAAGDSRYELQLQTPLTTWRSGVAPKISARSRSSPRWSSSDVSRLESQGFLSARSAAAARAATAGVPPLALPHYGMPDRLAHADYSMRTHGQGQYKTPRELELEEQLRYQAARAKWLEQEAFYSRQAEKAAALRAQHTARTQASMAQRVREEERRKSIMDLSQASWTDSVV